MIVTMPTRQIEYDRPITAMEVAMDLGGDVSRRAVCALVDGVVVDLSHVLAHDCSLELLDLSDDRAKVVYQHTVAHIVGQAVKTVFPTAKLASAPATKDGFWYDVAFATAPDGDALARIDEEMRSIIRADLTIEREEMSRTNAIRKMRSFSEIYKIQAIEALAKGTRVALYTQGDFVDVSRGPHLPRTGLVVDFVLLGITRVEGNVWRITGRALTQKAQALPTAPRAGRAKTTGVRMPNRKRNNM